MVSGCFCGAQYRIGTGFDFIARQMTTSAGDGSVPFTSSYCAAIGAWYGTQYEHIGYGYYVTLAGGGVTNIIDSSGLIVRSGVTSSTSVNITPCNFLEVTATSGANGSIAVGGTAYGKYRKSGDSIAVTATALNGYVIKTMTVNGSSVTAAIGRQSYTYTISNAQTDIEAEVTFTPTKYSVTCNSVAAGVGSVAFKKNGAATSVPFDASVNDIITVTMTPAGSYKASTFGVNGTTYSASGTTANEFSFVIYEQSSPTYACTAVFVQQTAVTNYFVNASPDMCDALLEYNSTPITPARDGSYSAYADRQYTATSTVKQAMSGFAQFAGWFNAYNELISTSNPFAWVQSSSQFYIKAVWEEATVSTNDLYVANSTTSYGTGCPAYVAGCRVAYTETPIHRVVTPETGPSVTKYIAGTFALSATAATGWSFTGVYVSNLDNTVAKFYEANGSATLQFYCDFDAKVFAIFENTENPVLPQDADQGHSSIATGAAASGLKRWEGASSLMTMRWHSNRFIASQPMTLSSARVYADGYATDGTFDTKLKVCMFESPSTSDGKVVEVTAKKQDAFRLPMRRPEKYIELEVTSPHTVSQIAAATSMEGLWQT